MFSATVLCIGRAFPPNFSTCIGTTRDRSDGCVAHTALIKLRIPYYYAMIWLFAESQAATNKKKKKDRSDGSARAVALFDAYLLPMRKITCTSPLNRPFTSFGLFVFDCFFFFW